MNLQAIYSNIEKLQAACIDNGQSTSCSLLLGTWKGQYSTQKYRHNLQFSFSLSPWPIIQVDCFTILTKVKDTWGLRQIIGDSGILNLILPETLKLHKTCTNMDTCDGKRVKRHGKKLKCMTTRPNCFLFLQLVHWSILFQDDTPWLKARSFHLTDVSTCVSPVKSRQSSASHGHKLQPHLVDQGQ